MSLDMHDFIIRMDLLIMIFPSICDWPHGKALGEENEQMHGVALRHWTEPQD